MMHGQKNIQFVYFILLLPLQIALLIYISHQISIAMYGSTYF